METSHPAPAPSAADVEKILSGIDYSSAKEEIVEYTKRKISTSDDRIDGMLNLTQSLPSRQYFKKMINNRLWNGEIREGN